MLEFYLTPASISYLTQSILALTITGYFVYRSARPDAMRRAHTIYLIGFFASISLFSLLLFLEASLRRGEDFYVIFPQNAILGFGLVSLLHFAYHFPTLPPGQKWEARLAFGLSSLYTMWELLFAIHRFQLLALGQVIWRPEYADYPLALGLLWPPVVLARQAIHASQPGAATLWQRLRYLWRPHGGAAYAARALALVYLIPFGLSLINLSAAFYAVSRAFYHISLSVGILLALTAFAVIYLDYLPETTSFIIKLASVTLMALLAVLGSIGWVLAPNYASHYTPSLPAQGSLRFAPNDLGGYDVTQQPFRFERELGTRLSRTESVDRWGFGLDFRFPFYGQTYQTVYASNDGTISMGQNVRYSYLNYRYGGRAPMIFPLLLDLAPSATGGLFARQESNRLILSWDHMSSFYQPKAVFTFQAILYSDGVFEINYDTPPPHVIYQPNNEAGASPWAVGVTPGNPTLRPQEVDFAALPVRSGARGIVQDYQLDFRRYLHRLLAPLAYLIMGSSVLVAVGFPILLYTNLVKPLNALLDGVQQMNTGHYETVVSPQHPDEIGFLTSSFNTMATELHTLIQNLEERVEKRVIEIKTTNAELAHVNAELSNEISERKQAEAKLRQSGEQMQILHEIDQAILGAQSPQAIARSILGRIFRLMPVVRVAVIEMDAGSAQVLAVEASRNFSPNLDRLTPSYEAICKQSHIHGVANIGEIVQRSPLQETLLAEGISAYLIVPLLAQDQAIGVLTLESDQPYAFTPEHVELSAQVAAMLAIAIHQAQLRARLEQRSQELQAQNAELDAFAHTVAHDLKNPIGIVGSSAQLLADYGHTMPPDELQQTAQMTAKGAFKAADIVNNLLLLASAHKMQVNLQPVDMAAVVKETLERLANMIQDYQPEIIAPPYWPSALGYAPWIEEVWANYISNALKYGGRPPRVELGATQQASGAIRFWLRDNGRGLTPEEQARLFMPFERLSQASIKGHGLGLSIVKRIVERMDGQAGVESEPGQGSVFYFTLPAARAEALAGQGTELQSPAGPSGSETEVVAGVSLRILLVEDNKLAQKMTLRMLGSLHYQADVAADGTEALEALRQRKYDVVLMDIHLPGMDGLETTRVTRRELAHDHQPYIIAMTAGSTPEERETYRAAGMDQYVSKPLQLGDLVVALARCEQQ